MITLTHFRGLKIRVNPAHVAALIPEGVLKADGAQIDSQTKCAVVLASGIAYHVRETVAVIAGILAGSNAQVAANE